MAAYLRILTLANVDFKVDLDMTVAGAKGRHWVMTIKIVGKFKE